MSVVGGHQTPPHEHPSYPGRGRTRPTDIDQAALLRWYHQQCCFQIDCDEAARQEIELEFETLGRHIRRLLVLLVLRLAASHHSCLHVAFSAFKKRIQLWDSGQMSGGKEEHFCRSNERNMLQWNVAHMHRDTTQLLHWSFGSSCLTANGLFTSCLCHEHILQVQRTRTRVPGARYPIILSTSTAVLCQDLIWFDF